MFKFVELIIDLLIDKKDNYSMAEAATNLGRGPVLVHSDSFHTIREISRGLRGDEALDAHIQNLKLISGGRAGSTIIASHLPFPIV